MNNIIPFTLMGEPIEIKKKHKTIEEHLDKELYMMWNLLFREINDKRDVITDELWEKIFDLHDITEKVDKKNKKTLKL